MNNNNDLSSNQDATQQPPSWVNNNVIPNLNDPLDKIPVTNSDQTEPVTSATPSFIKNPTTNTSTSIPNPINDQISSTNTDVYNQQQEAISTKDQQPIQPEPENQPVDQQPEQLDIDSQQEDILPPPPSFSSNPGGSSIDDSNLISATLNNKNNNFKKILMIGLLIVLFIIGGILLFILIIKPLSQKDSDNLNSSAKNNEIVNNTKKTYLTYWGLWEDKNIIQPLIDEYESNNPDIEINYIQESYKDYRVRLQSELARGTGPDIFRFHNTWLPMLKNDLATDEYDQINFQDYYDINKQDLIINNKIYGVPLGFDSIALFYNPQLFKNANAKVPKTWEELLKAAELIQQPKNGDKPIKRSGIALGTTNNIDNFSDILGMLILQNNGDITNPTNPETMGAIEFYTKFSKQYKFWDESLPNSTYAFANEKVAMIFAPSWRAVDIKSINPDLIFKTTEVPQLPETKVAWATYWAEGVSKNSENKKEAWKFLHFLSSPETLTKMYTAQTEFRGFGVVYPYKSMANLLETDPIMGSFVKQAEYAQSWYMSSLTHDEGINDGIINYYKDAINQINSGDTVEKASNILAKGVTQILSKYGVSSTKSSSTGQFPLEPTESTDASTSAKVD